MAIPNGTVLYFCFKNTLDNTSVIIETGAPIQLIEKKKSNSKLLGMLKTNTTINFISPAPIIPVAVNKNPTIKTITGTVILISPDSIAKQIEDTRIANTH